MISESTKKNYLKNKKLKHCLDCKHATLVGPYKTELCCTIKFEIIDCFPSIVGTLCQYYTEK